MSKKKTFLKNTLYSSVGFGFLILGNLIFNFFAARQLEPVNYGIYMSFFYLLVALTQPINSFQLAVAKYTAEGEYSTDEAIKKVSSTLFIISLIILLFFIVSAPVMKSIYNLPKMSFSAIGGGVVVMWLLLAGYRGVYQGKMNFIMYGINIGAEGILRAGIGILFIIIGWGIGGAIGASIVSGIIGVFILLFRHGKGIFKALKDFSIDKKLMREFLNAVLVLLPFGLIMNLDLTIVQRVIGGQESGFISACGLFGKNLIVLSMVVANVVYSYTLNKTGNTFWKGILMTIVVFIVAVLFVIPFGEWMINLLFDHQYLPVVDYLPLYIGVTIPIGILQHIVNFSIAKEIKAVKISIWIMLALMIPAYYFILKNYNLNIFLIISGIIITLCDAGLLFICLPFINDKTK